MQQARPEDISILHIQLAKDPSPLGALLMQRPWVIKDLFKRKPSLLKHLDPYHEYYLTAFDAAKDSVDAKVLGLYYPELSTPSHPTDNEQRRLVIEAFVVHGIAPHIKNPEIDLISAYVAYILASDQYPASSGFGYTDAHIASTISQWCSQNPTFRHLFNNVVVKALNCLDITWLDTSEDYELNTLTTFQRCLRSIIPRKYQNPQLVHEILAIRADPLPVFAKDLPELEVIDRLTDRDCRALHHAGGWQAWFPASPHTHDINALLGLMDSLGSWSADKVRQHIYQELPQVEMTTLPDELSC